MFKSTCKKVEAMLGLYIENKLSKNDVLFVKEHLESCSSCYRKYLTMKSVIKNLRFEYEKLLNEFEKIEAERIFSIREYDDFMNNISPYMDDELTYDESIKFRTYLLKSKKAREQLAIAFKLKNNIQNSFAEVGAEKQLNFEKAIIKKLKEENENVTRPIFYRKAAILIGLMLPVLLFLSVYYSFNYLKEKQAAKEELPIVKNVDYFESKNIQQIDFEKLDKSLLTGAR